jgi:hypothetical protein
VRVGGCGDSFADFGLGLFACDVLAGFLVGVLLVPLVSFTDLDLRFIRDVLVVGFGVTGVVSEATVVDRLMDRLRGRLLSATAFIALSENAETGGVSSKAGVIMLLCDLLFLLKIPRNPPLDSGRSNLLGFKGTRFSVPITRLRCTGGGRER